MLTFAVMPCLNEVEHVGEAVRSLLEPAEAESSDLTVIIVDNGSTDGTREVLADLARRHPGRVVVEAERCRGYVPPRRRGVAAAARIVSDMSVPDWDVLILQSDADTSYRPGYVGAMQGAAASVAGAIFEGSIGRAPAFEAEHPTYVEAERKIDSAVEALEAADEDDVVVDDKVCAYRLSDYMSWGGLFEERSDLGDSIHAETTRMFIRARIRAGTPKVRVNRAGAFPSRRRVLENPRYHFATLGFPRERTWSDRVASGWSVSDVDGFARRVLAGEEEQAVALRVRHLLALFRFLPAIILSATGSNSALLGEPDVAAALELVPRRGRDELAERPALAILDVLGLIDEHPEVFSIKMR